MYDEFLIKNIENYEKKLEDYASLLINAGINFQKGWALGICCPVICPDLARACTKEAFKQGARDVEVYWQDPYTFRDAFNNSQTEYLENTKPWPDRAREKFGDHDMAFIIIESFNSDFYKNCQLDRQLMFSKYVEAEFESFKRGLKYNYVICEASSREWASKVYPDISMDEAYVQLWNDIFSFVRVDGKSDAVQNWREHSQTVEKNAKMLNDYHFAQLHFTTGLGSDVTFKLPKNHKWIATAVNTSSQGYNFSANIPTEEVFTIPEKTGVNGKVVASRTLVTKSGDVDGLQFELKDGKIINFSAEHGQELLETIMNIDSNGRFMGEVAIVPYNTPISKKGLTFYTALLDENAGCHTAIGNAYSKCIEGGLKMTPEQLAAEGLNVCSFHEDCIFGTADTKIVGTTYQGEEILIFENGAFI